MNISTECFTSFDRVVSVISGKSGSFFFTIGALFVWISCRATTGKQLKAPQHFPYRNFTCVYAKLQIARSKIHFDLCKTADGTIENLFLFIQNCRQQYRNFTCAYAKLQTALSFQYSTVVNNLVGLNICIHICIGQNCLRGVVFRDPVCHFQAAL